MEYVVTKRFGKYKEGDVVSDDLLYIRRKLEEGGCLEQKSKNVPENKMLNIKENKESK